MDPFGFAQDKPIGFAQAGCEGGRRYANLDGRGRPSRRRRCFPKVMTGEFKIAS